MFLRAKAVLFLVVLAVPVFGQQAVDEAAQERQKSTLALLEQIGNDARQLKLPENRAFVAAKVGAAIWKADEKQARKLFNTVAEDLIAAQAEADAQSRNRQYQNGLIYGQEPRWTILITIANCDALLALDIMTRTRPARLARMMADADTAGEAGAMGKRHRLTGSSTAHFAVNELQNEQQLISRAADQDPLRAISLVQESLKKGVTYQTLGMLQKIHTKDPEAAKRLTGDAVRKLLEIDLVRYMNHADTIGYFLGQVSNNGDGSGNDLRISDDLIRQMAEKMIKFWLDPDVKSFYGNGTAFNTIEKLFPDRAARVKQKFDQINDSVQSPHQREYTRVLSENVPIEEMIKSAEKMPEPYMRNEIFRRAAQKMIEAGSIDRAEKLLEDNMGDEDANNYISQTLVNHSYTVMGSGKPEEAYAMISRIPNPEQKISLLVNLATTVYYKDPKANDKWAASVLGEARSFLPDEIETAEDITAFISIANASAAIQQDESFRMAESLVPTLNEISSANAVLAKLRNYGTFRNGEFQLSAGHYAMGISGFENLLNALKEKDFDRAVGIANGLNRPDVRLAYLLQMINSNQISNLPINTRVFISGFGRGE